MINVPRLHEQHAFVRQDKKHHQVFIKQGEKDCRILVNGEPITEEVELHHNDRLVFGSTQLWVFQNAKEKGTGKTISVTVVILTSLVQIRRSIHPSLSSMHKRR